MEYRNAPASTVLAHLLLRTPQGWTYLLLSVLNIAAGVLTLAAPAAASLGPLRAGGFFLVYPALFLPILLTFSYRDDFEPSWMSATFTACFGVLPFLFPYLHDVVA